MATVAQSNESPPAGGEVTQQQNECVNKSRLLSKPVKDEDVNNVQDQDMAENGDADKKAEDEAVPAEDEDVTNVQDQIKADNRNADQKTEDGEPKAKRAKAEFTETPGHGSLMETEQVEMSLPVSICPEHDERLKLYCEDDGDLSCIICRDSLKHKNHSFLPIQEAVGVYRMQLTVWLTPLQDALTVTKQRNRQQIETIKQHKIDMEEHKQQVMAEFERMHALLREQEEKMLKQLQEQEGGLLKEMETNLTKMQENQEKLEQAIATAEEKMKATDTNSYLTGMKSLLVLCEEQNARSSATTLITKKPSRHISKESIQNSVQRALRSLIVPLAEQTKEPQPVQKPDTAPELGVKQVWLIGDTLLAKAKQQARQASYGLNLGFPRDMLAVHWKNNKPLKWCNLIPKLKKMELDLKCRPDVLIIHLGDTELKKMDFNELVTMIKRDLSEIAAMYPGAVVMWSHMISQCRSLHTPLYQARKTCNHVISNGAQVGKYFVVAHKKVEQMLLARWKRHLKSGEEIVSFAHHELYVLNGDFMFAIKKAIKELETAKDREAASPRCHTTTVAIDENPSYNPPTASGSQGKHNRPCLKCGERGHLKRECPIDARSPGTPSAPHVPTSTPLPGELLDGSPMGDPQTTSLVNSLLGQERRGKPGKDK